VPESTPQRARRLHAFARAGLPPAGHIA